MNLAVEKRDDIAIVTIPVEELDAGNTPEFKREMTAVLDTYTKIVLDLTGLQFTDSSGLGAFLSCLKKLNAKGGELKLCGVEKQVRAIFELVRMDRILDIVDNKEEAVRAFQVAAKGK
jgi:anti-sigma B factor antagonist